MRIISGKYKGRHLHPPGNLPVRPTTDFAKTGLFNILENRYDLSAVHAVDLFSGTGSIAFELISRGCRSVVAVDQSEKCIGFIRKVIRDLTIENLFPVQSEAIRFLKKQSGGTDLLFADPPFDSDLHVKIIDLVQERNLLNPGGLFILEHASRMQTAMMPGWEETRKYGSVAFSFFHNLDPSNPQNHPES